MRFRFPHSHAFPGGRVSIEEDGRAGPECLVEFGDGVTVIADWQRIGADIVLNVPSHRTAKGTQVSARTWRLARRKDGNGVLKGRRSVRPAARDGDLQPAASSRRRVRARPIRGNKSLSSGPCSRPVSASRSGW